MTDQTTEFPQPTPGRRGRPKTPRDIPPTQRPGQALPFSRLRDDFLHYLIAQQGATERTRKSYAHGLSFFSRWLLAAELADEVPVAMDQQNLTRYFYALHARGLRPRSLRAYFAPLRALGAYGVAHGVMDANTALAVRMPKKDAANRPLVSREEIEQLLEGASRHRKHGVLYRAMLSVQVFCGLRSMEWTDLKLQHVSLDEGVILVQQGKGQKSRTLYPPRECLADLKAWLDVRARMGCGHDWLWAYDRGRRMGTHGIRDMLKDVKILAHLEGHDNIQPHSMRHAFATRLMENGADIKTIQAACGHSSPSVTFGYCHYKEQPAKDMRSLAVLKRPNEQAEPRAVREAPGGATGTPRSEFSRLRRQTPPRPR